MKRKFKKSHERQTLLSLFATDRVVFVRSILAVDDGNLERQPAEREHRQQNDQHHDHLHRKIPQDCVDYTHIPTATRPHHARRTTSKCL